MQLSTRLSVWEVDLVDSDYADKLEKFLHVMTECAQYHYVNESISRGIDMTASVGRVEDGAKFIWANNSNFVQSFLKLAGQMNDARKGSVAMVGGEVEKFTHHYCRNGSTSHIEVCQLSDATRGGV